MTVTKHKFCNATPPTMTVTIASVQEGTVIVNSKMRVESVLSPRLLPNKINALTISQVFVYQQDITDIHMAPCVSNTTTI
jgi:hypothetical protein